MMPDAASNSSGLVAIAVANAFALSVAVYIAYNISGGHVNPAVTFGMAIGGHISIPMAIFYWISQTLGSVISCILLKVTTVGQVLRVVNALECTVKWVKPLCLKDINTCLDIMGVDKI